MGLGIFSNLLGTVQARFSIGRGGPQIKNNAGVLESRKADDSAYELLRAASSATAANDVMTLGAIQALLGQFKGVYDINGALYTGKLAFYAAEKTTDATTANVVFNLTSDGTATGTALFSSVLWAAGMSFGNPANPQDASFAMWVATASDLKTITFRATKGVVAVLAAATLGRDVSRLMKIFVIGKLP